ncbi:glycosyltransferase family 2 protein [uncultured Subdoligranulum sp.]|uniref:glycosyltransferase family 2 protein n=1 Tax=uncultured Subdoligranulum sp. TaxID=512298 RepID=UPI002605B036|nr:glycosyltransferase family 2 protein [uncultured Subdoligranulum sp.]
MEGIWLSVVIPLHDPPQDQLCRAIDSARAATIPTEILLVDDGSRPDVGTFCRALCHQDGRIRYFYQENQGVSAARNRGMAAATGQYLLFLDADDWLDDRLWSYLQAEAERIHEDWVVFQVMDFHPQSGQYIPRPLFSQRCTDKAAMIAMLTGSAQLSECWGKLIKTRFVQAHGIRFPIGIAQGEDRYFNGQVLLHAQTVLGVPVCGYVYRYALKNTQRLLQDPDRYFASFEISYPLLRQLVETLTEPGQRRKCLSGLNWNYLEQLGSDAIKCAHNGLLDAQTQQRILALVKEQDILNPRTLGPTANLKAWGYAWALRTRCWSFFRWLDKVKGNKA